MGLVFVTGASRGLGREVARALVEKGHQVIGIGKDPQNAQAAASELGIPFELVDLQDIPAS
jgi:NAD(P)-dependent dehydrogenase (short-subunit alcohol dehydrogenase family)